MLADVAERRRPEERIGDRVQEHVRIRVPEQALLVGNVNASDDARPIGNERVNIKAGADAKAHAFSMK
jgi:hypothetical protein